MIETITPTEFLKHHCSAFDCADHHFTGGPTGSQPENNGSVFHEEGRILAGLAKRFGGPILELGADLGISSRYILEGLDQAERSNYHLISVDIYHKWTTNHPKHIQVHQDSGTYINGADPFKFVFIDGDHRYRGVIRDISTALRLAGPGAGILFHDTAPTMPAAKSASEGSDARLAVTDMFALHPEIKIYDITTHCGMMFIELDGDNTPGVGK